jgi:hypothetical protein
MSPQAKRAGVSNMVCGAAGLSTLFDKISGAVERLIARWRQATASDHYRPEKHYMRGPGPKNSSKVGEGPQGSETK